MTSPYNWNELEKEYLTGKWNTLQDFADEKCIPYESVRRHGLQWKLKLARINNKVADRIANDTANLIKQTKAKHYKIADKLLNKGEEAFVGNRRKITIPNALAAIQLGVDIERKTLGLDEEQDRSVKILIQIAGPIQLGAETITNMDVVNIKPSEVTTDGNKTNTEAPPA